MKKVIAGMMMAALFSAVPQVSAAVLFQDDFNGDLSKWTGNVNNGVTVVNNQLYMNQDGYYNYKTINSVTTVDVSTATASSPIVLSVNVVDKGYNANNSSDGNWFYVQLVDDSGQRVFGANLVWFKSTGNDVFDLYAGNDVHSGWQWDGNSDKWFNPGDTINVQVTDTQVTLLRGNDVLFAMNNYYTGEQKKLHVAFGFVGPFDGGTVTLDNVMVTQTLPVPEAASLGMLAVSGALLFYRRK